MNRVYLHFRCDPPLRHSRVSCYEYTPVTTPRFRDAVDSAFRIHWPTCTTQQIFCKVGWSSQGSYCGDMVSGLYVLWWSTCTLPDFPQEICKRKRGTDALDRRAHRMLSFPSVLVFIEIKGDERSPKILTMLVVYDSTKNSSPSVKLCQDQVAPSSSSSQFSLMRAGFLPSSPF